MPTTRIWQGKLNLQTVHEQVPINLAECQQHCFCTRYKYYVCEQHSNVVVLASFRVTKIVCKEIVINKTHLNNITYYYFLTFIADMPTHGGSPRLMYLSEICVAPMLVFFVNTPWVFKYSEQLAECTQIQLNANNMNMTLIGAPLLSSVTNSIIIQYKINHKF
jgi:hypothetical protein